MAAANRYQRLALSAATQASYASSLRTFWTFCTLNNVAFQSSWLPVMSENLLICYVTHCAHVLGFTYGTIKSHLSAIRHLFIRNGAPNPLLHFNGQPLLTLELTVRGIRKSTRTGASTKRLPITMDILRSICDLLNVGFFGPYMDTLLKAACTLAFFGFLRCGEFTCKSNSFDSRLNLTTKDVLLSPSHAPQQALINIKVSKTDPFRKGFTLKLFRISSPVCPVVALQKYLEARASLQATSYALLILPEGNPLTRTKFIDCIRQILQRLGYNPAAYCGHSFRIGAATTAAKANIPDHMIKVLGRWSSDCYQRYIHTSSTHLANTHIQLGNAC